MIGTLVNPWISDVVIGVSNAQGKMTLSDLYSQRKLYVLRAWSTPIQKKDRSIWAKQK